MNIALGLHTSIYAPLTALATSAASSVTSSASTALEFSKKVFRATAPYQPNLATAKIFVQTARTQYYHPLLRGEIKNLENRIANLKNLLLRLEDIQNHAKPTDKGFQNRAKRIRDLPQTIQRRERALHAKKMQKFQMELGLAQGLCLIFPHPGANVVNSFISMVSRIAILSDLGKAPRHVPHALLLNTLGLLGSALAFTKQAEWIDGDDNASKALTALSILGLSIELGCMAAHHFHWIRTKVAEKFV